MGIAWTSYLLGLPGVALYPLMHNFSLVCVGFIAILTFVLLQMMAQHLSKTKKWNEVCVIAFCGIYFPVFIVWLMLSNLLQAIFYQ